MRVYGQVKGVRHCCDQPVPENPAERFDDAPIVCPECRKPRPVREYRKAGGGLWKRCIQCRQMSNSYQKKRRKNR